jgi:hypothetical protein
LFFVVVWLQKKGRVFITWMNNEITGHVWRL